ncbi:MAG: alpha/beta hydrolase [Acidobacteria bacterium]|nr:alpha/beta hydrolase [Acidobacteriota bacterium]
MQRRQFLLTTGAAWRLGAPPPPVPKTHTYKTAGGCEIKADVYGAGESGPQPVLVWIHGGALILGSRGSAPRRFHNALLKQGYIVVSIDYRLAPETKLPAIVEDVQDAWRWTRERGPKLFGIDPERVAVAGGSAGGYLTLMTGFRATPRPRALVSFWGYGDITAPWYTRPDAFYSQQPAVPREEAYAAVGTAALSQPADKNQRGRFYLYCRQHGIWPKEVTGHDPDTDPRWFDPYCPVRNVTAQFPPTMLIHGTADTDVPYEESRKMAESLERGGVEHQLITVPGAGHGLAGAGADEIAQAYDRAAGFVRAHTQRR